MTNEHIIKNIQLNMLTRYGQFMQYDWSDEFHLEELREEFPEFCFGLDPSTMNKDDYLCAGSSPFEGELMLIPFYLLPFLAEEFEGEVEAIDGEKVKFKKDIDNDHRFGMLAYGKRFQDCLNKLNKIRSQL